MSTIVPPVASQLQVTTPPSGAHWETDRGGRGGVLILVGFWLARWHVIYLV